MKRNTITIVVIIALVMSGTLSIIIRSLTSEAAVISQVVVFIGAPIGGTGLGTGGDVDMEFPVFFFGNGVANGGLDIDSVIVRKEVTQPLDSYVTEIEDTVKARAIELEYTLTDGVRPLFTTFHVP